MLAGCRVLLIVGGGIAAYKALELARLLRAEGATVTSVLTAGGARFVTALSLSALTERPVYEDLWSLKDEAEMGHIRLSREADVIVVAPASADRLARMAAGLGGDLADAVLLAADKPVLVAPAMNHRMWTHPATRRNVAWLREQGAHVMEPDTGAMACGEHGPGRLPEPAAILDAMRHFLPRTAGEGGGASQRSAKHGGGGGPRPLSGRHALVTAGPTHEPIDPVRYLANRSSGRQGFAIAEALASLGARVTLIAGPVALPTPSGCERVDVQTAREMAAAVEAALSADIAVLVAAVADWGIEAPPAHKLKKADGPPAPRFVPNPDILATLAAPGPRRPALVIGFAAETEQVEARTVAKRIAKRADWIVGNDVSGDAMGGADNRVVLATERGVEHWDRLPKAEVARRLAERVAEAFAGEPARFPPGTNQPSHPRLS